jgi:GNAT superfamily N-acetyltransferase
VLGVGIGRFEAMIGQRTHGAASLQLSMTEAVPEHMRAGIRELTHLFVLPESRKQGLATTLMNMVCYEADKARIVLMLTPKSTGAMTDKRLIKFYEQFGFKAIQNNPTLMARAHG